MILQDFQSDNFEYEDIQVVQMGQIILEPKGDLAKTSWTFGTLLKSKKRVNYMKFLVRTPKLLDKQLVKLKNQRQNLINKRDGMELDKDENKRYKELLKITSSEAFERKSTDEQVELDSELSELELKLNGEPLSLQDSDTLNLVEESLKKLLYAKKNIPSIITLEFNSLKKISTFALFRYASLLTDIIANPSESDRSWELFAAQDPQEERDVVMLFDPTAKESPYFNPLYGPEEIAVGTVTATLLASMADSGDYFKNLAKTALQNAIHVAKRVHKNDATLLHVNDILVNNGNRGEEMIRELLALDVSSEKALENKDFAAYFLSDYYTGAKGDRNATKTYDNSSGIRNIMNNLLDNSRLRKVLNPPPGIGSDIDFDQILRTGDKVALSTATGVSDELGRMLGSFLILQLQAAIFRRSGTESTRTPCILYIDEFQDYATSSFEDVLTKGRSFAVSATMATQTLGIVGSKAGQGLVENLQSNARNVIVYPGSSAQDAQYFVSLFGQEDRLETKRSVSQAVAKESTIADKIKDSLPIGEDTGGGDGQRESVSDVVTSVERFSQTQVIYGPNVNTGGDSFGFVYFRAIVKNSVQVPAVAKIEYIPYELKKKSDELLHAYDAVNKLDPNEDSFSSSEFNEANKVEDPLSSEMVATVDTVENLSSSIEDGGSDPSKLSINPSIENLSDVPSIDEIETPDFAAIEEIPTVPDLDELPDLSLPVTETSDISEASSVDGPDIAPVVEVTPENTNDTDEFKAFSDTEVLGDFKIEDFGDFDTF